MADDASYATFLTRANQDLSSGGQNHPDSTSQARSQHDPSSSNSAIPASLTDIKATYTSDTDSDFEPVLFSYASHQLPTVDEFRTVLGPKTGAVTKLTVSEFDPRGEYGDVVERVKRAGGQSGREANEEGQVVVFRVESGTRVEYFVLTVGERSLVGVVARAVES